MTTGRFESTYNLRPSAFENRPFWAETHRLPPTLTQEIKEAESCPYHDLRAGGRFMPEKGQGVAGGAPHMTAKNLVQRPAGGSMNCHLDRAHNTGCGGALLPEDTDPIPPSSPNKRSAAPWTNTGKGKGLFSIPPYISAPDLPKPKQEYEPPFHTGAAGSKMNQPYPFIPEQPAKVSPPRNFRLKAGTFKPLILPPIIRSPMSAASPQAGSPSSSDKSDSSPKKRTHDRGVFRDHKNLGGTFGRTPAYYPTPYHEAKQNELRNFSMFTYWAKTKRDPPVQCPWDSSPNRIRVIK